MLCPQCGATNVGGNSACMRCGAPLKESLGDGASGGAATRPRWDAFCGMCGAQVAPAATQCTSCGAPLNQARALQACGLVSPGNPQGQGDGRTQHVQGARSGAPPKTKVAAALFAFFLGPFGVHNFYLGHTGLGLAQLLIFILGCYPGMLAARIWSFVDFILILCDSTKDSDGRRLA